MKSKAYYKNYYQEHKAERQASVRKYVAQNQGKILVKTRKYRRNHLVILKNGRQIYIKNKRIRNNNCCELCGQIPKRLFYHHWDDEHPEWGMWLCTYCHHFAERVDHNNLGKYLQLKAEIEGV